MKLIRIYKYIKVTNVDTMFSAFNSRTFKGLISISEKTEARPDKNKKLVHGM